MLQAMGLQRVGHNWETEQQQQYIFTQVWKNTRQYFNIGYSGEDSGEFQFYFLRYPYCILFFTKKKKERKEAENVRLNIILGSTQFILQALESH